MKALWCWLMHRRYRCPDRRLYEMVRHSVDMPFCLRCEPPPGGAAMSERVEEIRLDREGIAHFLNEQHQGWYDGMGSLSQTRVYGTALLLADAVRAALAQAERERDEARAERNARARDVMHLEAENERLRAELEGAKRFGDIQLAEKRTLEEALRSDERAVFDACLKRAGW